MEARSRFAPALARVFSSRPGLVRIFGQGHVPARRRNTLIKPVFQHTENRRLVAASLGFISENAAAWARWFGSHRNRSLGASDLEVVGRAAFEGAAVTHPDGHVLPGDQIRQTVRQAEVRPEMKSLPGTERRISLLKHELRVATFKHCG